MGAIIKESKGDYYSPEDTVLFVRPCGCKIKPYCCGGGCSGACKDPIRHFLRGAWQDKHIRGQTHCTKHADYYRSYNVTPLPEERALYEPIVKEMDAKEAETWARMNKERAKKRAEAEKKRRAELRIELARKRRLRWRRRYQDVELVFIGDGLKKHVAHARYLTVCGRDFSMAVPIGRFPGKADEATCLACRHAMEAGDIWPEEQVA